jgi:hypothetical protein
MKTVFYAAAMIVGMVYPAWNNLASAEEHAAKKVCVDVKDKEGKPVKDAKGNVKQNCKQVKQHKKLEVSDKK